MKVTLKPWAVVLTLVLGTFGAGTFAKQDMSPNPRVVAPATGLTAGDQSNKTADVAVTKKIRQELMNDESLSTTAKNVKIIVLNNGVTLKGEVKSNEERARVLKHAYITAPKHKIYNQISIVR